MTRARRGRGEGALYQRSDGTWVGAISAGMTKTGHRRRRTVTGKSKRAVQEKLLALRDRRDSGDRRTLEQYLTEWFEYVKREKTHSTYKACISSMRHVIPRLGNVRLSALSPGHLEQLYNDLATEGIGASVRNQVHRVLSRALKRAMRLELILRNPVSMIDAPTYKRIERPVLSIGQVQQLLKAAEGDRLEALYVLAVTTGMRQGELFGLHWDDVDLKARTLSVRRTVRFGGTKAPKADSRRRIDLTRVATAALERRKARAAEEGLGASSLVFATVAGRQLEGSKFGPRFYHPMLEKAKLPHMPFHSLRHTFATILLSSNVHPKVAQEMLGHSSIGVTLDIYSHVIPTMQTEAVAKLEELFEPVD